MPITIKDATVNDASLLASLGAKTFFETFAGHNTADDMLQYIQVNFTTESLTQKLSEPGAHCFIAQMDDEAVGYAYLRVSEHPEELHDIRHIELERIYVLESYHGNKIGLLLMNECIHYARKNKYQALWLGVWEKNIKAIKFYQKMGFTVFGQHDFVLGTDKQTDHLMKLIL